MTFGLTMCARDPMNLQHEHGAGLFAKIAPDDVFALSDGQS